MRECRGSLPLTSEFVRVLGPGDLETTFDDPKYYTRPFGFKTALNLIPDSELLKYVCTENEKDGAHLPR
jgi:hypothetical protein